MRHFELVNTQGQKLFRNSGLAKFIKEYMEMGLICNTIPVNLKPGV